MAIFLRHRHVFFGTVFTIMGFAVSPLSAETAQEIYRNTGVQGGFVVHLGCGEAQVLADLHQDTRYLVQGLDTDAKSIYAARVALQAKGIYGAVTAELFDGERLPYVDGVVNLVVASDPGDVGMDEITRVLAPEGVAYVRMNGKWEKVVKPRPSDIDEWTHFLHDASNHAVAQDRQVGPPKRLRWLAGPKWCRSHEFPSSSERGSHLRRAHFYDL